MTVVVLSTTYVAEGPHSLTSNVSSPNTQCQARSLTIVVLSAADQQDAKSRNTAAPGSTLIQSSYEALIKLKSPTLTVADKVPA